MFNFSNVFTCMVGRPGAFEGVISLLHSMRVLYIGRPGSDMGQIGIIAADVH